MARSAPYKSGSKSIDALLAGGYHPGRLVMFYGPGGSGKSQVAMQAALCGAIAGSKVLFLDTEGAFRPERLEEISKERGWDAGGALERIEYLRTKSFQEQMEAVREIDSRPRTRGSGLVIVDTLTRNFSVEMPGRSNISSRQSALNIHLSEMGRDAFLGRRAYVLTNRVTFDAKGVVGIGGRTVQDMVHSSLSLERTGEKVVAKLGSGGGADLVVGKRGVD